MHDILKRTAIYLFKSTFGDCLYVKGVWFLVFKYDIFNIFGNSIEKFFSWRNIWVTHSLEETIVPGFANTSDQRLIVGKNVILWQVAKDQFVFVIELMLCWFAGHRRQLVDVSFRMVLSIEFVQVNKWFARILFLARRNRSLPVEGNNGVISLRLYYLIM